MQLWMSGGFRSGKASGTNSSQPLFLKPKSKPRFKEKLYPEFGCRISPIQSSIEERFFTRVRVCVSVFIWA